MEMKGYEMQHINSVWTDLLKTIIRDGERVTPRGKPTLELLAHTTTVDMGNPVISLSARKLGYKFMAAEAHWILSGDNRVATIAPYSKAISRFSDDGVRFFGAYGPPVIEQLSYVVQCLKDDVDSRQAVLTIWRQRPGPTKDVPCTVALQFMVRDGKLNCHATMRSSDAWLGWVYDTFNFSMIAWTVLAELLPFRPGLKIGRLFLTAASQHLYESDLDDVNAVLASPVEDRFKRLDSLLSFASPTERSIISMLDTMRLVGVDGALDKEELF